MAEGAGAAVDVHLFVRQAVLLHCRHGHDGERFVDLVEVDLLRVPAGKLKKFRDCAHGGGREFARRLCVRGMSHHHRERGQAALFGGGAAHHHQRRGAVGDRARVRRGDGAVLAKRRLERGDLVEIRLEGLLVGLDELLFLARLDGNRGRFPREPAFVVRLLRALERGDGESILRLS